MGATIMARVGIAPYLSHSVVKVLPEQASTDFTLQLGQQLDNLAMVCSTRFSVYIYIHRIGGKAPSQLRL